MRCAVFKSLNHGNDTMGLGNGGFSYEPIGQSSQPLQQRCTPWIARRNIGTVLIIACFGTLAIWGSMIRISCHTTNKLSSATLASPAAGGTTLTAVLPNVGGSSSGVRLMRQVRVFTDSYRGTTNTTRYRRLIAEPHRENTLQADVNWPATANSSNVDEVEFR